MITDEELKEYAKWGGSGAMEIAAELMSRRENDRWIPAEERLPEYYVPVLTMQKKAKYPSVMAREKSSSDLWSWANRSLGHFVGYVDDVKKVTHWRPLPQPPEVT